LIGLAGAEAEQRTFRFKAVTTWLNSASILEAVILTEFALSVTQL